MNELSTEVKIIMQLEGVEYYDFCGMFCYLIINTAYVECIRTFVS